MYILDFQRIEELRKELHMSKTQLAKAVCYSQAGYAHFEKTSKVKSKFRVLAFSKVFGMEPSDILLNPLKTKTVQRF